MKKALLVGFVPLVFVGSVLIFSILGTAFSHLERKGHEAYAAAESARVAELSRLEAEKEAAAEKAQRDYEAAKRAKVAAAQKAERERLAAIEKAEKDRLAAIEAAKVAKVQEEKDRLAAIERANAAKRAEVAKAKADTEAAAEKHKKEQAKQYKEIAVKLAKQWISRQLNYPDTASFSWDQFVDYHEGYAYNPERWVVQGEVQSQNAFGVPSTHGYRVCLVKGKEADKWVVWWCEFGGQTYHDPDYEKAKADWEAAEN